MKTALVLFVLVGIVCAVKEKGKGKSSKRKSGSLDENSSGHKAECETQSERETYCLHGGTCFRIPSLNTGPQCHCTADFAGTRCEYQYVPPDL
ncbi:pro-neuregulin-4, membrane-bound isoform-like [Acropora millepora]|uniref:pro-neuregulin-4, membrane-bound isoform-like n=1 Tax=Acropora millepora TaxID=45264 RepID=UPI001CF49212|nr:pro-neuregulin-4, membrane-bound isoform-like [Acropora millepora]